jgi:hypothetical protein
VPIDGREVSLVYKVKTLDCIAWMCMAVHVKDKTCTLPTTSINGVRKLRFPISISPSMSRNILEGEEKLFPGPFFSFPYRTWFLVTGSSLVPYSFFIPWNRFISGWYQPFSSLQRFIPSLGKVNNRFHLNLKRDLACKWNDITGSLRPKVRNFWL